MLVFVLNWNHRNERDTVQNTLNCHASYGIEVYVSYWKETFVKIWFRQEKYAKN